MAKSDDDGRSAAFNRRYLRRLGKRIRALRERQGITLKQLAKLSGLSDRYIIAMEKGEANPSMGSLLGLVRALQTSSVTALLPEDARDVGVEFAGPARDVLSLLENRPRAQVSRVLAAVAAYLEQTSDIPIALLGMRGSGKTTVGRLLSRRLKVPFYELDELIEKHTGLSLAEIFDLEGEQYYRNVEEKTLERALRRPPGVIAVGGGLVMNPTAFLNLRLNTFTVWLQTSPQVLIARVRRGKDSLRLGTLPQATQQLRAILDRRTPYYAQADLTIDTTRNPAETVVKTIVDAYHEAASRGIKQKD